MNTVEPLYQINVTCIYCETTFQTSRLRSSFKKTAATETDFNIRYKLINPDYYVVRVCPTCGFASTENFSNKITTAQKQQFEEQIGTNWILRDYGGQRTWEEALETYQLALLCAQIKEEKIRIVAGLLHHIAWLYREKQDEKQEQRFLQFALNSYIKMYENEQHLTVNDARLMYLIGELNRRLGQYYEAVKWFSRVINDKSIIDSAMIAASRQQWAEARENMLAARMNLPDEMSESAR